MYVKYIGYYIMSCYITVHNNSPQGFCESLVAVEFIDEYFDDGFGERITDFNG